MDSDLFPLRTVGDVRKLFDRHLRRGREGPTSKPVADSSLNGDEESVLNIEDEPNLSLLSIVAGAIENNMTQAKVLNSADLLTTTTTTNPLQSNQEVQDVTPVNMPVEPELDWSTVESLLKKFEGIIRGFCDVDILFDAQSSVDKTDAESYAKIRKLIKHVADIVWNTLSKSQYKDRPHLQSIYSYLTGNKLDCFGVAFAVVAACQMLRIRHVHLALSEDHAWVVFGPDGTETAEVTWHGKGNEDKRGLPVDILKAKTSWLYLAGQPVVCDRSLEVAAIVSSINFSVNATCDSIEVGSLQKELLWLLYEMGHLQAYPMALGNLGDLEEISPSVGRPSCETLFEEAIRANKEIYHNHHVYPYTYQAGFYFRGKNYRRALEVWAEAADVIKLYRYSKDDEEIYKEFMEIANELIPSIVKNDNNSHILSDPKCFSDILRFYDGICCWEEGSPTPVLHIGWAKHMVATCTKFEPSARSKIDLDDEGLGEDEAEDEDDVTGTSSGKLTSTSDLLQAEDNNNYYKNCDNKSLFVEASSLSSATTSIGDQVNSQSFGESKSVRFDSNSSCDSKFFNSNIKCQSSSSTAEKVDRQIEILSTSCASNIINLDYLLGKAQQPFVDTFCDHGKTKRKPVEIFQAKPVNSISDVYKLSVKLNSVKMRGMRSLLCAEKLNTSAITLQMTAQSQTDLTSSHRKSTGDDMSGVLSRPKRARRD